MVRDSKRPWRPERADYEDLYDVVRHREMVYRYSDESVPDDDLEKILEAARWAPSGHNTQPWEFIVLRDEAHREGVVDVLKRQREWMSKLDTRFPSHGRIYLDEAPVLIVLAGDVRARSYFPKVGTWGPAEQEVTTGIYYESIGCCMQTIHLAAKSLGYGTVHLTVRKKYHDELREALDLPDYFEVHDIVPLGVPAFESPGQNTSREPLTDKVHYGTFDEDQAVPDEEYKQQLDDTANRVQQMHGGDDGGGRDEA